MDSIDDGIDDFWWSTIRRPFILVLQTWCCKACKAIQLWKYLHLGSPHHGDSHHSTNAINCIASNPRRRQLVGSDRKRCQNLEPWYGGNGIKEATIQETVAMNPHEREPTSPSITAWQVLQMFLMYGPSAGGTKTRFCKAMQFNCGHTIVDMFLMNGLSRGFCWQCQHLILKLMWNHLTTRRRRGEIYTSEDDNSDEWGWWMWRNEVTSPSLPATPTV